MIILEFINSVYGLIFTDTVHTMAHNSCTTLLSLSHNTVKKNKSTTSYFSNRIIFYESYIIIVIILIYEPEIIALMNI